MKDIITSFKAQKTKIAKRDVWATEASKRDSPPPPKFTLNFRARRLFGKNQDESWVLDSRDITLVDDYSLKIWPGATQFQTGLVKINLRPHARKGRTSTMAKMMHTGTAVPFKDISVGRVLKPIPT